MNFMRSVAGQCWGADPAALITIFKSCIRPVLEYATIFMCDAKVEDTIVLDRIQWACIRIALGSTKTTHTGSLEVLSGLMPLSTRRDMAAMKFVERRYSNADWNTQYVQTTLRGNMNSWIRKKILQLTRFARYLTPFHTLPCFAFERRVQQKKLDIDLTVHNKQFGSSAAEAVQEHLARKYSGFTLYATDGSKDCRFAGFAVVNSQFEAISQIKTPLELSIFFIEFLALLHAVRSLTESSVGKYVILTDSLSCLKSLQNCKINTYTPYLWFELKKTVQMVEDLGSTVTFLWVPAHKSIPINEAADQAAKAAGQFGPYLVTQYPASMSTFRAKCVLWKHGKSLGTAALKVDFVTTFYHMFQQYHGSLDTA